MPWNETEPMNERVKFLARYLEGDVPFASLCEAAGISRKTGYKWVDRYEGGGVAADFEAFEVQAGAQRLRGLHL